MRKLSFPAVASHFFGGPEIKKELRSLDFKDAFLEADGRSRDVFLRPAAFGNCARQHLD